MAGDDVRSFISISITS